MSVREAGRPAAVSEEQEEEASQQPLSQHRPRRSVLPHGVFTFLCLSLLVAGPPPVCLPICLASSSSSSWEWGRLLPPALFVCHPRPPASSSSVLPGRGASLPLLLPPVPPAAPATASSACLPASLSLSAGRSVRPPLVGRVGLRDRTHCLPACLVS